MLYICSDDIGFLFVFRDNDRLPPMRRTVESEDKTETTPRGSAVGTKRTRRSETIRREGLEAAGQRRIMVQLTPEEQGGFMDRMRVNTLIECAFSCRCPLSSFLASLRSSYPPPPSLLSLPPHASSYRHFPPSLCAV